MRTSSRLWLVLFVGSLSGLCARAQGTCDAETFVRSLPATAPGVENPLSLEVTGAPSVDAEFALRARGGPPDALGVLFLSREQTAQVLPGTDKTLYVPLSAPRFRFELDENGDSPELLGWSSVPPGLCGVTLRAQAAVRDPSAVGSVLITNAIELHVGLGPVWGGLLPFQSYAAGTQARALAIGDLDLDGVPDLAVAGGDFPPALGTVSVLLGAGDGTFAAPLGSTVGETPQSVAIADLDVDGVPDLAVVNFFTNDVSILLGAGDGTFAPAASHAAGSLPRSLAIADLNLDGAPDLVVAKSSSDNVSVLLGNGDGTLGAVATYAAGPQPRSVAVADLDQDGAPDIVATNDYSGAPFGDQGYVAVLLGNGDGTFAAHQAHKAGDEPAESAVGDLNLDGIPDLAVANEASQDVSVLFGLGDGDFVLDQDYAMAGRAEAVAISDLNQDGVPDIVVSVGFPVERVAVLLGVGDGTFAAGESHAAGTSIQGLTIADLDLDGSPDIAVPNLGPNAVSVLLNQLPE